MEAKKNKIIKNDEKSIQKYRFLFQSIVVLICIWIGVEFYLFINFLESGGLASEYFRRPAGVEAFLPISALMSLYFFFLTGEIHQAHPAGFFILIGIITVSLAFGKSFCSWMCPVGFISELIGDFGDKISKKLFKKKIIMPKFIDIPLRSLKYLLLGFFVYSIFFAMTAASLKYFLDSPYNIMADVKMFYFFADISRFSLIVIAVLFVLSIVFRNFWCRYLCPYGALLGVLSLASPNKIKRDPVSCIDCGLCTKACPSNIKVDKKLTVFSDECSTCLSCVDVCPVKDTLQLKSIYTNKAQDKKKIGLAIAAIYLSIIALGVITGNWHNKVSQEEYLINFEDINSLGHPTSTRDIEYLNKKLSEKEVANGQRNSR
ncbi:MAG: 4Fe-4S binding protein [Melioribacteraceae bacterium]|nr:4Fe-4S binding protein [Melioribacteraceae bacterium]